MTKQCVECGESFTTGRNQKFCSTTCSRKFNRRKAFKNIDRQYNVSSGTVGAIQELRVSVDLMAKGYEVFRALSPACSCDILIMKNKKLYPIEVRTGYELNSGKISYPTNKNRSSGCKEEPERYAVALRDKIVYIPELPKEETA